MAESTNSKGTSGDFAKKVQRRLSRGKEKVLQRLGKTTETRDDQFEHCLQQFNDQQTDGNRMYKDFRNYINAVRDMREASRRLFQSLFDVYESDWVGEEDLGAIVEGEDLLWNDYEVKLLDQAVRTMESYVGQFPDVREKVAKRGRKLVDYDSSLHHLEALQMAKKRDDIKINKAKEEMKTAKSVYEGINNELKEELPVLYESRIGCYVSVFSALGNLRDTFFKELSTFNGDLQNVIKELQAQFPDKTFAVRGVQRYGSLRRRTLMSPKAWKASFSEFHRSYSPKGGQRYSFRSPDKPRQGTLSREGSTLGFPSRSSTMERPVSESVDLEVASCHSENPGMAVPEDAAGETSGKEIKSGEGGSLAEKERDSRGAEKKGDEGKALASESSSELNNSFESESLELQLSTVDGETLHIEEEGDDPGNLHAGKPNGLKNGDVSGLNADAVDPSIPPKDAPAEKVASPDSKSTDV
ncbi:bridging integrator 2a [Menidia menidia]